MQVLDWDGLVALVDEINNSLKQKVPITRTINSKALLENINLDAGDVGAIAGVQKNGIDLETDNENKVNISVPEKTSDLINDSGYVTDEDINFTGGTGISIDGKVINHTNSIRAGTASGSSGEAVFGESIEIPTISYDSEGHIVDTGVTTLTLPVVNDTDEKVATEQNNTTKAYLTGTVHSGAYIGTLIYDSNIYLDTTAGTLTAKIFNGDLTGNADSATVSTSLQITQTNPDSATSYYIPFGSISSGALTAGYNNGLQYRTLQGTTSAYGYGGIYLGNSTASGTAGNKYGFLRFYGRSSNYWTLSGNRDISNNYTVYMPNSGGSLVVATTDTAVGSSSQPVYINASGVATAITESIGSSTGLMYLNNGTLTASNASLGDIAQPLYLNSGEFNTCTVTDATSASAIGINNALITARAVYYGLPNINSSHAYTNSSTFFAPTSAGTSGYVLISNGSGAPDWMTPESLSVGTAARLGTSTIGSATQPIYLNGGTPVAATATVGSGATPIYLNGGVLTALPSTVGSGTNPVYLSAGTITQSSSSVGSGTKPVYLNSGTITVSSSTVGGNAQPVYLSSGTITPISNTVGSTTQPVYLNAGVITAMSGALSTTYGGTGNTSGRATYVSVTSTNPTSSTSYYPLWVTGTSSNTNYSACVNNGFRYNTLQGDESTDGYGRLYLGNSTASGESGNKYGMIRFYGLGENYWTLSGNKSITSNYTVYFPSSGGGLVVSSYGSAVGSGTKPVYISSSGVATASSSTVGSGVIPTYLSSGTITASSSTVGSGIIPIYMNSGTLTASSSSVGTAVQPVYLNSGTLTACTMTDATSATALSTTNSIPTTRAIYYGLPSINGSHTYTSSTTIYAPTSAGTSGYVLTSSGSGAPTWNTPDSLTAGNADVAAKLGTSTVGSGTQPIYLSSGTATASTSTVGTSVKPIYLNAGVLTASSSTVGSSTQPVYLSSGTITACSTMATSSQLTDGSVTKLGTTTYGGTSQPIYWNAGVPAALSATVGGTTQPVYMNAGTITAMSGALSTTYGGTGNTSGRATYANISTINPDSGTTYYIPFSTGASSGSNYSLYGNNGIRYYTYEGTTDAVGVGRLQLGNSTASGTAANKVGQIVLFGTGTNYWYISGNKSVTSNYTLYLPLSGGCLVAATNNSTVGSSTRPVYVNSSGVVTQCNTRLDDESIGGYISSGGYKDVVQTYDSSGSNRVGTIRIQKESGYNAVLIGAHDESNSAPQGLTVRSTDGVIRVTVTNSTEYTTYEVRNIAFSTSVPSSLNNGTICFVYS